MLLDLVYDFLEHSPDLTLGGYKNSKPRNLRFSGL